MQGVRRVFFAVLASVVVGGCGRVPAASDSASSLTHLSRPSVAADGLRWTTPRGWTSRVLYGGLGTNPVGLMVIVAANLRLPKTAAECERLIPRLRSGQVVVWIDDYAASPLAPRAAPVGIIRPAAVRAAYDPMGRTRGLAENRVRFAGHTLVVTISYGARRPPATVLRSVKLFLKSARPAV
jgi:hypothetical protein